MTEIIVVSLILATAAALAVCICVVKSYKSGISSPIYPLEHYTSLNLSHREDRFLHRNVTRVRVQSSNNSKKR